MRYQINKREYINLMTHCRNSAESYDGKRMDLLEALEGTHAYWRGEAADTLRCELRAYLESGEYDSMLREYRRVECELELLLPEIRFQMELQDRMSLLLSGQHKAEPEELYLDMEMQEEMLDDLAEMNRQINSSVNEAINAMSDIADIVDLSCDMKDLREKQEDLSIMIRQYSMMSDENMNGVRKADACLCGIFDWIIGNDSDEEEDTPSEVFLDLSKARSHHGVVYIEGEKWEPVTSDEDDQMTTGTDSTKDSMVEDVMENAIINDESNQMPFTAIDMLTAAEGKVPYIYSTQDGSSHEWNEGYNESKDLTFGIGHKIESEEEFKEIREKINDIGNDTEALDKYIYELLREDVLTAMNVVDKKCGEELGLEQNEYDALVMLVYNIPSVPIENLKSYRCEKEATWDEAGVVKLFTYTKANDARLKGLVIRRNNELNLFFKNDRNYYTYEEQIKNDTAYIEL